jgi:hypothetical protein
VVVDPEKTVRPAFFAVTDTWTVASLGIDANSTARAEPGMRVRLASPIGADMTVIEC